MSFDREDNMTHVHEREESRDAARFAPPGYCDGRHDYRPNRRGGGTCYCGDSISAEEL